MARLNRMPYFVRMSLKRAEKFFHEFKDKVVCGMDEAGRGPWAGPVTACAIILPKKFNGKGIKDSKLLSESVREKFYKILTKNIYFGVGSASHTEIDSLGIIAATNLAFIRALKKLCSKKGINKPEYIVVDGRDKLKFSLPHKTVIKGDNLILEIACASIIAKVTRDRLMKKESKKYPRYKFGKHKGYGTRVHQQALSKYGPCEIHRKSFAPVAQAKMPF
jgi:ribonuclease HII